MSHFVEGNFKSYTVGSVDLAANVAVKFGTSGDAGKLVVATAGTDKILGVVHAAAKAGTVADVHLRSAAGTICLTAGGTIAVNDAVTATTAGKGLTTTSAGDQIIGYALEAKTTGLIVELMPSVAKY